MARQTREDFLNAVQKVLGNVETVSRDDIEKVCNKTGLVSPQWLTSDVEARVSRGVYRLPSKEAVKSKSEKTTKVSKKTKLAKIQSDVPVVKNDSISTVGMIARAKPELEITHHDGVSLVPEKTKGYVPFGHFNDVRTIIKSGEFYPVYVTGLSGNGKTVMIEQVCAAEKREMIRVNIIAQTDEDDLLGGFRLMDGKTVWQNGPVVVAMERGAVLLLDEVDLGTEKLLCLQPVLEGKQIYLKKINKIVKPAPGFTIIATANTKGKGSEDGRFIGTNILNEAFLERFTITLEQEYPASRYETKILNNVLAAKEIEDAQFVSLLVNWAEITRKSFAEGVGTEIISTRRLVHICQTYSIFKDKEKSITACLNRFDADTKQSFLSLYKKLDESMNAPPKNEENNVPKTDSDPFPF